MRVTGIDEAVVSAAGTPAAFSKNRLISAAQEFEGQMLKELLRPLVTGGGLGQAEDEEAARGTLEEFGAESLGNALSKQGGFGIANQIVSELLRNGHHPETKSVTAVQHFDTHMSSFP